MSINSPRTAEVSVMNLSSSLTVGAWSVKLTIDANTDSSRAPGSILWGLIMFTADGLVVSTSSAGSRGFGVWRVLPNKVTSFSFSFIEQNFPDGQWRGNHYVYAPMVDISADGSILTAQNVQALRADTSGVTGNQLSLSMQGTRITLTTPDQLPRQGL